MATVVIELNDICVTARDASGVLAESPGFALVDADGVEIGSAAHDQARLKPRRINTRFWDQLSLDPLPQPVGDVATLADLAYRHLSQLWRSIRDGAERVVFVVPGSYTREQLSLLLGIARECDMPVAGLVDAAVMAAQRPVPGRRLMHLDLMLHRTVLTRLAQGRRLRRGEVTELADNGWLAFEDAWVGALGDAFVRNTRFDPLHDAESEQRLYDALPEWLERVDEAGTPLELTFGAKSFKVVVKRATLADAAQPLLQRISRQIAAATRAGEPVTLLMAARLANLPGVREAFAGLHDCELLPLEAGAATAGVLRREETVTSSGEALAFVTSVPWQKTVAAMQPPATPPPQEDAPTHLLYRARAYPLAAQPLVVGADVAAGERAVAVVGETRGVSARHCSVVLDGGSARVEDHSRHGTFVNDSRIDGVEALHTGDLIGLGGPEAVLQLIRVDA